MKSASRLKSIDFLRGSAALAVVITHAFDWNSSQVNSSGYQIIRLVCKQGYLGVPLFFVISGFCIHLSWAKGYAQSKQKELGYFDFWKRRFHRLYPPYFIVLCLCMGMVVAAYLLGKNVPLVTMYPQPRPRWMLADFVAHVLMLHGLHPVFDGGGGNVPFWTLAREEYFYAMYLILILWRRSIGLRSSMVIVALAGVAFPLMMTFVLNPSSEWWGIVNKSAIVLWIQWCLGMVAVEAYYGLFKLPNWCRWLWLVPVWAALAKASETYMPLLAPMLWGVSFFTLLNYCISLEQRERWPAHILTNWLARVGIFSYSLYLVHRPIAAALKQVSGHLASTSNPYLLLLIACVITTAGYFGGKLFFILVESKFLNTRSEPRDKARLPVSGFQPAPLHNVNGSVKTEA